MEGWGMRNINRLVGVGRFFSITVFVAEDEEIESKTGKEEGTREKKRQLMAEVIAIKKEG